MDQKTCGKITCHFFPPNTTGLIQPALDLANKDTIPGKIFENFNILDVIKMLSGSWNKCPSSLLAKSWHNLGLNIQIKCDLPEMEVSDIQTNLQALGLTLEEVNSWLLSNENVPASLILSDEERVQLVTDHIEEDQEPEELIIGKTIRPKPISANLAISSIDFIHTG